MILTKSLLHTTDIYIKKLREAGIETVRDFLMLFPKEYEDKSDVLSRFSLINITEKQAIKCDIEVLTSEMTRNKKLLIKAVLTDSDGIHAEAVWFNQRIILSKFAKGDTVLLFGKPKYEYGRLSFPSAEMEHFSKNRQEIQPLYSDVNYIPGTWIRDKMKFMKSYIRELPLDKGGGGDFVPDEIRKKHSMRTLEENISAIHFPKDIADFERAKYELGYGELFRFQMIGVEKKYHALAESEGRAVATPLDAELMKSLIEALPFALTNKQKIVLFQILKDMEKPHAMARLLQGDVGTGKTVVALLAAIHIILKSRRASLALPLDKGGRGDLVSDVPFREYNPENKEKARKLRNEMSEAEKKLWLFLRSREETWNRQKPIEHFIVDFYCSKYALVIEVDGATHSTIEEKEYDQYRTDVLEKLGLKVVRFTNEEVYNTFEGVCERIIEIIQEQNPPNPLYQGGIKPPLSPNPLFQGGIKPPGSFISLSEENNEIQVAIMAPTEILARQHFAGSEAWLMELGISSDLLVGSLTPRMKEDARERLKSGQTDIVFGTHALIQDTVGFANLGFVVVDEQHRFGVEQRKYLEEYCSRSKIVPHRLNMSATPIPRTLALTIYGDQDVSVLDEYPAGRKSIHTRVIREDQRNEVYRFIEEEVRQGRQVYWISPLVTESETLEISSATEMQITLSSVFPKLSIGLIHGKMSGKEKDRIMQEFYENKIHILSSTSVVEVGVNNPNATVMCIEASERFGLSQLHQFRGRVGRGEHQSYCYLFTTKEYKTDRLKAMEQTNDGFELAEIDLELRGPGEVYGVRQSGVPDFHFADLRDVNLISEIREDIEEWMKGKNML